MTKLFRSQSQYLGEPRISKTHIYQEFAPLSHPCVIIQVPEAKKMAGDGNLMGAIEMLLTLEKQTRTGGDMHSTSKILVAVVQMCYEAKEWTTLNEHLILLSKKRSQLKAAVTKMVQASNNSCKRL